MGVYLFGGNTIASITMPIEAVKTRQVDIFRPVDSIDILNGFWLCVEYCDVIFR